MGHRNDRETGRPFVVLFSFVFLLPLTALGGIRKEPPRAGPSGDWWDAARASIARTEYNVTWQNQTALGDLPAAYQAPNRANDFRTYFTEHGIRIVPRSEPEPAWELGLTLADADGGAPMSVSGNQIHYFRGGFLESYRNDERGLAQNLTLLSPEPNVAESPVDGSFPQRSALGARRFLFRLSGSLLPRIGGDGKTVDFCTPDGRSRLHLAVAMVSDAVGQALPARFEGFCGERGSGILLLVEDAGAVYPVFAENIVSAPSWTAESDQASAGLGISVATAGDVNGDGYSDVIVGAYLYDGGLADEGAALLWYGSSSGLGTDGNPGNAGWTGEGEQAGAWYGYCVGTAGDVNADGYSDVIISAYKYGACEYGAAFAYHGSASGLGPGGTPGNADWSATGTQCGGRFGGSVATAGDVNGDGYSDVIVGAHLSWIDVYLEGLAFVYYGSATGLSATAGWTARGLRGGMEFGFPVASAGDVNADGFTDILVGGYTYTAEQLYQGAALLWTGSASGLGPPGTTDNADWMVTGGNAEAYLGYALGTAGDVNGDGYSDVVVGAYGTAHGEAGEGAAYGFHGSSSGLEISPSWTVEGNVANGKIGAAVGTAGDVNGDGYADVVVGAPWSTGTADQEGKAFLYEGSSSGLFAIPSWTASGEQAGANYGNSVGTAGDVNGDGFSDVIVGAMGYDGDEVDEGRVFVYHGGPSGPASSPGWSASTDNTVATNFGHSVAGAGDVNGDGFGDVIVGAPWWSYHYQSEGCALAYYGSASGPPGAYSWARFGEREESYFGYSVAGAGDVNGDGYDDALVGAYQYDGGLTNEGLVCLYLGSAGGLPGTPSWTAEGEQQGAQLGVSLGTAGDVNGDGFSDVIVGANGYSDGEVAEGAAFAWYGSPSGLGPNGTPSNADWSVKSDEASARLGSSVGTAGDVNGDGYSDVVVGAPDSSNPEINEGYALVFCGSPSGLLASSSWGAQGNQAGAHFGASAGTAGDVNGDGYSDVIVGAPYYDDGQTDEGKAWVYLGGSSGLSLSPAWTAESDRESAIFGCSVAAAGDVNGDGFSDVAAGAYNYSPTSNQEGKAYLYLGSAGGPSTAPSWSAMGDSSSARLGISVASAGDVNGDGYADLLVGAEGRSNPLGGIGSVFLYYGNGEAGRGFTLRPRQLWKSGGAQIGRLGASENPAGFRLEALGRSPFGRGKVKLEWEVKPLGSHFNGTGLQRSPSWLDAGTAGAALGQLVSGLSPVTVQHWRARILYDPVSTPFQARGPWFANPWGGWNEADLRTLADSDGDGVVDVYDCLPADNQVWRVPGEAQGLQLSGKGNSTLTWVAPPEPGCTLVRYDVLRSSDPSTFTGAATCVASGVTGITATESDGAAPSPVLYYLVRSWDTCGGNLGKRSDGTPRAGRSCP